MGAGSASNPIVRVVVVQQSLELNWFLRSIHVRPPPMRLHLHGWSGDRGVLKTPVVLVERLQFGVSCLDVGTILKPDRNNLAIDLHADADNARSWNLKDPEDTNGVKSRTGFLLTFAGVSLLWKSSLQSLIALLSQESE